MSAVRSAPVPLTSKSVEPDDVKLLPFSVCVREGPTQLFEVSELLTVVANPTTSAEAKISMADVLPIFPVIYF